MTTKKDTLTQDQQALINELDNFVDYAETCGRHIAAMTVSKPKERILKTIINKVKKYPGHDYALKFNIEKKTYRGMVIRNL